MHIPDEADSLCRKRQASDESGCRSVLNELLISLDGFTSNKDDRVLFIAATNAPHELDDAMLRRLPQRLLIDLPNSEQREAMIKKTFEDNKTRTYLSDEDIRY